MTHTPDPALPRLQGSLGVTSIVLMVVAAAAPLTVVSSNVPLAIALGNGNGAPYAFIIAAVVLLLFSVGFVAMSPRVTNSGAFFSYVALGLGRRPGNATAAIALVAYTCIQCAVWGFLGVATNSLVSGYVGVDLPWWVYSFLFIAITALLGYRHIELSAKVLGVALAAEILIVVVYDAVVFATSGGANVGGSFAPLSTVFDPGVAAAITFAIAGFMGFEATVVFRDEARDPDRTLPRATYISVLLIGGFYAISGFALIAAVHPGQAVDLAVTSINGDGTMLTDSMQQYLGVATGHIVQVLLITSLFACALSFHNVIARYLLAMSQNGLLPARVGAIHAKHRSPSTASLTQSVSAAVLLLALVLIGLNPIAQIYGFMAGVAAVGFLLLMILTSIAVWVYFRGAAARGRNLWRLRIIPAIAVLVLVATLIIVLSQFTLVTALSVPVSVVIAAVPAVAGLVGLLLRGGADRPASGDPAPELQTAPRKEPA
ncbi:APC family permease [Leucobacter japonicus]|uniref:APC family permease n=1 Tax=Leucobacter japonicus TaxID=1461259 RepID=UPI0006A7E9D1|nr:APC family permease [Leucobacter japonicus]